MENGSDTTPGLGRWIRHKILGWLGRDAPARPWSMTTEDGSDFRGQTPAKPNPAIHSERGFSLMNLASAVRKLFKRQRQTANCRRRTRCSPLSLEPLETRCLLTAAAPLVIDFGEGVTVRGVNRLADGTGLLVGDYVDPQTGNREGRLFTVAPDGSSYTSTTLGSLGGETAAIDISPNGQYIAGYSVSATSDPRYQGEATIWRLQAPEIAIGIGYVTYPSTPINESMALSVSNNGVAVGHSNGGLIPFRWEETVGMQALPGGAHPGGG